MPDLDPLAHVKPGDPAPINVPCYAIDLLTGFICLRFQHPVGHQHIAHDGDRVLATWTGP